MILVKAGTLVGQERILASRLNYVKGTLVPKMKAAVFVEPGRIVLESKPIPEVGPLDALLRVTTTTICGTDVHILRGNIP